MVVGSNPVAVTYTSHIVPVLSKEFLDTHATKECRFIVKHEHDMIRRCSQKYDTNKYPKIQLNHLAILAKCLSICLETKWL